MTERTNISSGSPYEATVGYSRAVKVGSHVFVAGTTAPGVDAEEQAREIFERIGTALEQAGASLADVVRTRVFLVDIERDFESVGAVHGEVFGEIRPACAFIGTAGLVAKDLLLEVEVDAIVSE
ncbi:RidA family protein [Pseudoclavibacter sp. VKM Ac-2867]|uniref:RidA family protein n=1 Tax=Pseudoclavibacter sp. VKM Ac-2867 TaxID=2783829 RepID=UPI00188BEA96|nr:RidA family protein [Pseudoclavibacter sp. VKM Ac-2867]MBF4459998.1 RidA family protein [Pseudoclavibacter sp. VKM Ac-2867]